MEQPSNSQMRERHGAEHLEKHRFKKGQSGNPKGRPKGSISMKEYARLHLRHMTEEERLNFIKKIKPIDFWKMAEGNPMNQTDLTSGGKSLLPDQDHRKQIDSVFGFEALDAEVVEPQQLENENRQEEA